MNRFMVTINQSLCRSLPVFLIMALWVFPVSLSRAGEESDAIIATMDIATQKQLGLYGITVDSIDLTARRFFEFYMSKDADQRENARLYLLGVMDATEGKSWCDYRAFKTITLREDIYEGFNKLKKLESHRLNERASKVIEDILSQLNSCSKTK